MNDLPQWVADYWDYVDPRELQRQRDDEMRRWLRRFDQVGFNPDTNT